MGGEFEITLGRSGSGRRRREQEPLRILVLADFCGRTDEPPTFAARRLSIDDLDGAIGELAPRVCISGSAEPRYLVLESLDDLHPDRLAAAVPHLRQLLELERTLDRSPGDAAALDAVDALLGNERRPATASLPAASEPAAESDDNTLERLLGRPRGASDDDRAKHKVRELIESALGSTQRAAPAPHTKEQRARLAELLTDRCRAVLHDAELRAVERAWRSAHWLASRLEDDQATVHIVHLPKAALAAHVAEAGQQLDRSPLHSLLTAHADGQWDAIVGDYSFGLAADDLVLLATLGALAARAGAPFLAHGEPTLAGCAGDNVDEPWDWRFADEGLAQLWSELRSHPAAQWISLSTPRFLLRQPYGARTDAIERFAFEELPPRPPRDRFLWGNPAFACALLLAQSRASGEGNVWPSTASGSVEDLPMAIYGDGGGDAIQPPLEHAFGERARAALAEHGLVAFTGGRNTNRIATSAIESIAK
jgi:type VI secretion system ImpC/EvpB family protein